VIPGLQFGRWYFIFPAMVEPLALVLYEKLLPGTQLVNRLQDLKYRVETINDPAKLVSCAEQIKPILVLVDVEGSPANTCSAVSALKKNPGTRHLPVIAFAREDTAELRKSAEAAGVSLFVTESAIVHHLPQLLDQALQID
jgi:CheY-like chemotaxis protein